jgi:hypothetical protein
MLRRRPTFSLPRAKHQVGLYEKRQCFWSVLWSTVHEQRTREGREDDTSRPFRPAGGDPMDSHLPGFDLMGLGCAKLTLCDGAGRGDSSRKRKRKKTRQRTVRGHPDSWFWVEFARE